MSKKCIFIYKFLYKNLYLGDQEDYDDDDTSGKNEVKFPDIDRLIKSIPPNKLIENRRKLKTGFKLFQVRDVFIPCWCINGL